MANNSKACAEIVVLGKVQGVFFRRNAQKKAIELKLVGYVKNENNGTLFIHAEGSMPRLLKFISWANVGEGKAVVESIKINWSKPTGVYTKFDIIKSLESAFINLSNIVSPPSSLPKDTIIPKHIAIAPLGTRKWARNRNIDLLKGMTLLHKPLQN